MLVDSNPLFTSVQNTEKKFKYHYEFRDLNILDISLLQLLFLMILKFCPLLVIGNLIRFALEPVS